MSESSLIISNKGHSKTWRKLFKLLSDEHTKSKPDHEREFSRDRILLFFSTSEFIKFSETFHNTFELLKDED